MVLHLGWKHHKAAAYQHLIFVGKASLLRSVVKWYLNYLCDFWITYDRGYALMDTRLHNDIYCPDIWHHYWHLIYLLGYPFHKVDICSIFFSLFWHLILLLTFELPNFRIPLILWTFDLENLYNLNVNVKYLLKLHDGQQNRATVMSLFIGVILNILTNNYANEHIEQDFTL